MTPPTRPRSPSRTPARAGALLTALACLPLAAPVGASAAPDVPAPVAADDASDPDRPVQVDITRLDPRTLPGDAPITLAGTLTNTGSETLTDLDVRLQRGDVATTRAELVGLEQDADPVASAATPFQVVPGALEPGDEVTFTLTTSTAELGIDREGAYPALVNLNGAGADGQRRRVGEAATWLVRPPAAPAAPVSVSWLWPLVERTHRDARGAFADDGLAEEVAEGGRLDRALGALEELPRPPAADGGPASSAVRATLAVDPALVEELQLLASGDTDLGSRAADDAAAFLARLRTVAADHDVLALPYGDVDADALTTAGLGEVLTRSLPGSPEGTARDDPDRAAADGTAPAEGTAAAEEVPTTGAGEEILTDALGVEPRTDLAWTVGGAPTAETVGTLRAGGVREVVVDPAALTDGGRALGVSGGRAAARATVPTAEGDLGVLVGDGRLGGLAGATGSAAEGAEQAYLAELAVLALQAGADPAATQTVLVAPPREVDADPETVAAMMADTARSPWLRAGSLDELLGSPAAPAGELVEPTDPGGLAPEGMAAVAAAVQARDDLAGAVEGSPGAALAPWDAATARATAAAWRTDPEAFARAATDLQTTVAGLRDRVTLLSPADGTYSLASADAPLVLTVDNALPFAVRVLLQVRTRGNALDVGDIGPQVLAPGQRTTLQVPTEVRQSGRFRVVASLATPDGGPLGRPVELQVRSTAYGSISLIITIGAAALLGLLFLRRLVRFVLRRRRGTPEPVPEPTGSTPPTRSPV